MKNIQRGQHEEKKDGEGALVFTCVGAIVTVILLIVLMFKVFAP